MVKKSAKIGIIGGMGPEATLDLFRKIIRYTPATKDQEHIHLIIDNNTSIPDRTDYILGKGENPLPFILESARLLESVGVDAICMACNTAHIFENDIRANIHVDFISIVESVLMELQTRFPQAKSIGLAGTMGVLASHIYTEPLIASGYKVILPPNDLRKKLMEVIYSTKGRHIKDVAGEGEEILQWYKDQGADVLIMACTELPLLLDYLVPPLSVLDSTEALAKNVVHYALERSLRPTKPL